MCPFTAYARAPMNAIGNLSFGPGLGPIGPVTPPSPDGLDLGGSLGIDYMVSEHFSLGSEVSLDALFISMNGTVIDGVRGPAGSAGSALLLGVHAALHFGLN